MSTAIKPNKITLYEQKNREPSDELKIATQIRNYIFKKRLYIEGI